MLRQSAQQLAGLNMRYLFAPLTYWVLSSCLCWSLTPVPSGFCQTDFGAKITAVPAATSGIDFVHTDGGSGQRFVVETVLGSLALFDYDGDGLIDIYFVNGSPLRGTAENLQAKNRLYKNNGDWTFSDVTECSGLGDTKYGMGVVIGDYDNDGDGDVFLSNFGLNAFYVNQGDGTFCEATAVSGLNAPWRVGAGNCFFDMDNDGDLDLYCASYVEFDYSQHRTRTIAGHAFYTGPNDYAPAADYLYRNDGDGSFTDVSELAGVSQLRAPGMGVLSADFDDDGDQDVFVANDQQANFLLLNDGQGRFTDAALLAGVALDRLGRRNGNMGVDYADLNGDGILDLITTTYQDEMPIVYQAAVPGLYSDVTNIAKIDPTLNAHVTWGVGAVDFDLDGDRDLFFACGHFLDNVRFINDRTDVKVTNYVLANDGRGRFTNVTLTAGSALQEVESSRGAGFDDLDNDGDVDVVVLNVNAPPTLGKTDAPAAYQRISIELIGIASNRDAFGSKVTIQMKAGGLQTQVKTSSRGYESSYGHQLYFGGGKAGFASAKVTWPSGKTEEFPVDASLITLREGYGTISTGE